MNDEIKFEIPRTKGFIIRKPELEKCFEDTFVPCTLVRAMSGFGKTSVFAEAARRSGSVVRWHTFRSTDNRMHCFLSHLESMWETIDGKPCDGGCNGNAAARLLSLIRRVQFWDMDGKLHIVFDNLQSVSSEEVLQMLFSLQSQTEEQISFILMTNEGVPEDFFPLLLSGKGVLVSEGDLRLTPEEVWHGMGRGTGLSREMLERVTTVLCGWPYGVQSMLPYLDTGQQRKNGWRRLPDREGNGAEREVLEVCTFGSFRVSAVKSGKELSWRTRKGRELFAYLLDMDGRAVERRQLIEILWQEEVPPNAVPMLHNMIYHIRKELSAYCPETALIYENKRYRLCMETMACDFRLIKKMARLVEEKRVADLRREYNVFLDYWGSYLEDIDSCWAEGRRRYYDDIYMRGSRLLAARFEAENNGDTAIRLYENILRLDPYSETAMEKILLLYGKGRAWEKMKTSYREFAETMKRDLGIAPGKEVAAVYHRYLN